MSKSCDVLIVGAGVAGIYTALNLNKDLNIIVITKEKLKECNSYLAQGGIATALNEEDVPSYIEDTLKAGNYKNNKENVSILVKESRENIIRLINYGVPFDRNEDNSLQYTREGGHSKFRIVHVKDETGKHVMDTLYSKLKEHKNIEVLENHKLLNIIRNETEVLGGICSFKNEEIQIRSKRTILATGGLGGLFSSTTNFSSLTGDGIAIALKNGIKLKDMSYLQLHPTVLYEADSTSRRLLLSESLRGEGGVIRNLKGEKFVDPLQPRDVVTKAILEEIEKAHSFPYVYLDLTKLGKDFLTTRFPFLYNECLKRGFKMEKNLLPIAPAHHYAMGGIEVNKFSETSLKNLYAIGETACTGVHGSNRLASNSLLEGLVFGYRCACKINDELCANISSGTIRKMDLVNYLKERVDNNYVKLFKY